MPPTTSPTFTKNVATRMNAVILDGPARKKVKTQYKSMITKNVQRNKVPFVKLMYTT